ncbi:MAG: UDP-4-amino-4-deoxy-L-arabinose--oxoglutarate aminotransferase [Verrucomicrobiae bacterium]|nr:UDP-4-amino-4-deoxy-L-arabinose--oxoglutarate aminotransferase [Verrucomicrobiae bacterium]
MNLQLAIDGGPKFRPTPFPTRQVISEAEKAAVLALFDEAIANGEKVLGYNGPQEEAYGKELAAFLGGGFADGVNSGTNAVYLALRSLDLEPGGEVIVGPVTDPGGIMPVVICGHTPVIPDSAPGSYNTSAEQIAARITDKTRAIVVAHIAGIPCEMDAIMKLGLPVVEDCAQAHGTLYRGQLVGTFGAAAAFSMMFGKQHVSGGQGGMVFTKDEKRYWRIRQYADRGKPFGLEKGRTNVVAALNCNMDELHACIGRVSLKRLPAFIAARRRIANLVDKGLRERVQTVRLVTGPKDGESSHWFTFFHLATDRLRVDKARFVDALWAEGLIVGASYSNIAQNQEWYQKAGYRQWPLPNITAADATHFRGFLTETWTDRDAEDFVGAVAKVERAYLK